MADSPTPALAPGALDEHGDSPAPPPDLDNLEPEQRVSFYVQAVDDMIDAVLEHEGFLFDPVEFEALNRFRALPYQSRYLFSRLLLRKHAWIRRSSILNSTSYKRDISDLTEACEGLCRAVGPLPAEPGPSGLTDTDKEEIQKRSASPAVPPPVSTPSSSSGVIDLTFSDSENEDAKPLKRRKVQDAPVTPKKAKLEGKPPDIPSPSSRPSPRKLVSEDGSPPPDLSHFAHDTQHLLLEPPEAILALLSSDELKSLGKKMKVPVGSGGSRGEWIKGLLRTSKQSTLSFFVAKPAAPSPESTGMERKTSTGTVGVGYDDRGNKLTQSSVVSNYALKLIGDVVRLSPSAMKLFGRLSLVYHRTAYSSPSGGLSASSPLTMSLLARFGKRRYPKYIVARSWALFSSRTMLREFEAAMQVEKALEECLDGIWGVGVPKRVEKETKQEKLARYRRGVEIWESVEDEWRRLCEEAEREMKIKEEVDEAGERRLYYRRRFHPGWPLSRAAYKAAACYAKLGDHDAEVAILRHLLSQTSFRRGKRGDWYDRLALVLMRYPLGEEARLLRKWGVKSEGDDGEVKGEAKGEVKGETELQGTKKEKKDAMLRARREEALTLCEKGLADPYTHLIYKSSLQRRIARLESALDVPAEQRRAFDVVLAKAVPRTMEGERLDDPTIGRKSVWRASDGEEVSVEDLCLEQYQREGWKGFHSENGVLTMIFALIFWDILFAPVDGVFETPFQTAPLDLATDAFAIVRRPAINERLAAVAAGEGPSFLKETDDRERPLETFAVGIRWGRYTQEDLLEIVECMGPQALAAVLTVFVEEYGHRTGGIPDLCLWNPTTQRALFSEVKGPGDQLSETQKVWIDVLLAAGVGVEVVKVVETKERRKEESASEEEEGEDGENGEGGKGGGKKRRRRAKTTPRRARSSSLSVKKEGTPAGKEIAAPKKARGQKRAKKEVTTIQEEPVTGPQEMVLSDSD